MASSRAADLSAGANRESGSPSQHCLGGSHGDPTLAKADAGALDAAALIARLERVPFSRWHLRARLVVGSATFFDAFDALSLAFVLPVLVPLWHITPAHLLYELIFPIGLMMTGQIGAVLVPTLGWQVMFLIGGIPGLLVTVLLLRLPESPRWLISKGRLADADNVIRAIEASAGPGSGIRDPGSETRTSNEPRIPDPRSRIPSPGARELLSPAYRPRTLVVWTLWAAAYFITNGLNNWMPTLYSSVYHLSLAQSLRAGTLTNVAQVVVLLGCAFAIDRIGRRRWTVAGFVAGALLLAMLGTFAAHSIVSVIVLVTISYGIVGSVNAVLYLYTPEIYPTRMRAIATGAATCWLRLASAAGPVLVGYLVAASGTGAVFLMFAAAGVVGAVAAAGMLETRNRRLEELAP